jgi:hypothetical protein
MLGDLGLLTHDCFLLLLAFQVEFGSCERSRVSHRHCGVLAIGGDERVAIGAVC